MKVFELIEILQGLDQNAVVKVLEDSYYCSFCEAKWVRQELLYQDEDTGLDVNAVSIS